MDDELRDHLERKTKEYVAKGMARQVIGQRIQYFEGSGRMKGLLFHNQEAVKESNSALISVMVQAH